MAKKDIDNRFMFHPATEVTAPMHDKVRNDCRLLAHKIDKMLPESREKSLALTKLEEAMMWANAAIARNLSGE
jgi:putative hemolysin